MKTLGLKSNFRVVVEPRSMGDFGGVSMSNNLLYGSDAKGRQRAEKDIQDRCEEIAREIKRHVDNVRYAEVEFDQGYICDHCGSEWTEESDSYNGGCCAKDEENAPEASA